MKFFKLMHRSIALLILFAMLISLVPNVFATEQDIGEGKIEINVPAELKDEDIVVASFGEDGKIVYETASEEVRSAINAGRETVSAITDSSGTTILENRAGNEFAKAQRLAFFVDPSNSEGNTNYVSFTLTATIVKNLVAAGVTDLFVMTKDRAGNFSTTNLATAIANKGSAKVYAWMHCARDDKYLAENKSAAQYHFRAGYNNMQNGADTSITGFVHLANADYITYMKGLMAKVSSAGADGILLDSVRFGTEFTGWDKDAKEYFGKTYWNALIKAMCATAYELYGSTYRYKEDSNGYYYYVSSGGTAVTSGNTLEDLISSGAEAAKYFGNYRKSIIANFIGKMKEAFGSSKIIAVALERDWENTNYYKYVRGQDPYSFRNHVKYGFCVTMQVRDYHSTAPATMAQQVAKYTNVMVGVDFYKVGTVGNYGYTIPDTVTDVAEAIFTARYNVAKTYKTYRGYILGAACYTAGHMGVIKVSLSGSGASPTITATYLNTGTHAIQRMFSIFNIHGDTDCDTSVSDGGVYQGNGTMKYFANVNSTGNYIGNYADYAGASIAKFGKATLEIPLTKYTVDWDKLPFIRWGFYVNNSLDTYLDTVAVFPIYIVANHASCTKFTTSWISAEANCTTKGFKQHKCTTCGYTYIEEVAKLDHSYTSAVTTQPTCEVAGVKTYTCSRSGCGTSYTEAVAALGHSYSTVVTAPTCTAGGYTIYTCSTCSHSYVGDNKDALGHSYSSVVTAPTCTADGYTTYTCSACADSYVADNTDALGHSYQSTVIAPTCTESGHTVLSCGACGDTYVENVVAALGHDYSGNIAMESTCTEEGVIVFTCAHCANSYRETLPLAGHAYSAQTTEATCTTDGFTVYTCADCGYSYTGDAVAATGHGYDAVVTEPTCFENGYTTYTCISCGDSYVGNYTAASGHNYSYEVIDPTCTEVGYTVFTCVCGDSFADDYVAATGHNFDYSENGDNHIVSCENCDYYAEESHNLEDFYCTLCGAFGCKHEETSVVVDAVATCTTDGIERTVCNLCGNTLSTETIQAFGHDEYKVSAKAATCTEAGNHGYWTCRICGGYYTDETFAYELPEAYITVAATGHNYVATVTAPTCTEAGYTTYACSACGDSYVVDETDALGHNYEAVTTAPTCAEAGYTTYTCPSCGDSYTADEIAALGHSHSYTNNGSNHTITCANCDYSVTEAHTYTDGTCECGAVEVTEPKYEYNSALTTSMAISVGAEMQVTYTVLVTKVKNFDSFYVEVVREGANGETVTTVYSLEQNNLSYIYHPITGALVGYSAAYTGINASMMGDVFSTTLYAVTADGTVNYGNATSSSIKSNLLGMINDAASSAELKTLAVDMLNYGAAAQSFFGYDVENPVNADLTEEQKALGTQAIPEAEDTSSITGTGGVIMTDVSLQSKVMLYLTFVYSAKADSNLTVVIKDSEGKVLEELVPTKAAAIAWQTIYANVGAKQMREPITIELHDNGTCVSKTLTWNIESYVAQTRAKTDASEALLNAVNAMLIYGDSAAAYMTSSGQ